MANLPKRLPLHLPLHPLLLLKRLLLPLHLLQKQSTKHHAS
ncbi:MAG: hypothetical protein Q8O64_18275 [Sideroxyarcus sp.]|nr:hypothetical protein [Sideroxyarcus sp.]